MVNSAVAQKKHGSIGDGRWAQKRGGSNVGVERQKEVYDLHKADHEGRRPESQPPRMPL
jgi:hypothetical protein